MKKTNLTIVMVLCVGFVWLGVARADHFETHETNPKVPAGTVYDTNTKLLWEMKTPSGTGDVHDVGNMYNWSSSGDAPDGTAFTNFLGTLNDATSTNGVTITGCFAGHCDWRLPEIEELRTIVDFSTSNPSIAPIFGPTASGDYWSATTYSYPRVYNIAWAISFDTGLEVTRTKTDGYFHFARAVRSGF